jgi:chromosome segregation ATPase
MLIMAARDSYSAPKIAHKGCDFEKLSAAMQNGPDPEQLRAQRLFLAQDAPVNRVPALLAAAALLAGCQSAYYAAAEKVGYAKREILVDRVESARDAQQDAREEITDALTEFRKVVDFEGGELEKRYKALDAQLKDSERAADAVRSRIAAVEDVAGALFKEWQDELGQYSSPTLRARSEEQLRQTKARYGEMIGAMKRAEARLEPALAPLRDQVLFLKHNLNAQAVAGLKGEVVRVDAEVNRLVQELDAAIAEADRFIAELEAKGGSSS